MPYLLKRVVTLIAALYFGWLALVLLVAMPLLNALLPDLYRQQTGRELRSGELILNPFTLSATLTDAGNRHRDGEAALWSVERLLVDISLSSLWRRGVVLDRLQIEGLALHIEQTAPDRWNFSDILDHRARHFPPQPDASPVPLPLVAIGSLHLDSRDVILRAPHLGEPLAVRLRHLQFSAKQFTTRPATAPLAAGPTLPTLATGPLRFAFERLEIDSLRQRDPFAAHLDQFALRFDGLSTTSAAGHPYELDAHGPNGGRLRWRGDLSLAGSRSEGELLLQNIDLQPVWQYLQPQLNFRTVGGRLDAEGRYRMDWRGETPTWHVEQGRLALREVAMTAHDSIVPPGHPPSRVMFERLELKQLRLDGVQRQASLGDLRLQGLRVESWNRDSEVGLVPMFTPRQPADPASTTAATAEPEPGPPWQFKAQAIHIDGEVAWRASQVDIERLRLAPLQVTVENLGWPATSAASLQVSAQLNEQTRIGIGGAFNPSTRNADLHGSVEGLPMRWGNRLLGQHLTATIDGGSASAQWTLAVAGGEPTQLRANGTIDDFRFQRLPNKRRLLAWKQLRFNGLDYDLTAQALRLAEVKLVEPFAQFRINRDGSTNFGRLVVVREPSAGADNNETETAPADAKPLQIDLANLLIDNGVLDFRDTSLPRPFIATIGQFSGAVANLSSRPGERATVDLDGSVDGYAPVTLTGTAAPLAPTPTLDLALAFNNLDLATFTPYARKYAGYSIDRGQLTVKLDYTLQNDRIEGNNRFILEQLRLGEKVPGESAPDLPLGLAIALLTDANGVMDVAVDITGDIDDPQFDLGDIVWKAMRNLLVKAVTSPFKLLGRLVGSQQEQLGYVDFAPGEDQLPPAGRDKLADLRRALEQRPGLRLAVIGRADPAADTEALQAQRLERLLIEEEGLSEAEVRTRGPDWREALTDLHRQRFPEVETEDQSPEQLAARLRDTLTLRPDALSGLASRRAQAAKRILVVELGLPPGRVFIDSGRDRKPVEKPRASFKLDG